MDPTKFPFTFVAGTNAQLVIVTKERGLHRYKHMSTPRIHGKVAFAIGEGAPFAYGAMFAMDQMEYSGDAYAEVAVGAAIVGSPYCGGLPVEIKLD